MSQEAKKFGTKLSSPKKKLKVKVASAFEMSQGDERSTLDISQLPKRKPVPEAEHLALDDEFTKDEEHSAASSKEKTSKYVETMLRMAAERKQERRSIKK